jgi:hypothetical protein
MYAVEMASYGVMYVASLMKIGTGFQAILNFASEVLEAVMLVLLMGVMYGLRR